MQILYLADGLGWPSLPLFLEADPVSALFDLAAILGLDHFLGHPIEFLQHDGLAAHSGHEGDHQRTLRALVQSRGSFGIERTAAADAAEPHVGFDDADNFEPAERFTNAICGIRPDGAQTNHADFHAFFSHVVYGETRGDGVAALEEEDDLRIFGFVFLKPRIVPAPEDACELFVNFLDDRHASFHGACPLQLERWTLFRHDLRAVRNGAARIERV